jgi:hypothetical protein
LERIHDGLSAFAAKIRKQNWYSFPQISCIFAPRIICFIEPLKI